LLQSLAAQLIILTLRGEEYCSFMGRHSLDSVFLVAPTSDAERVRKIVSCSRGFVYVVSRTGVTGEQLKLSDAVLPTVNRVREHTELPIAVGFGISKPEQVQAVWDVCDGAVVGSAIVSVIENVKDPRELPLEIGKFCRWLTQPCSRR
jgi:tryptophan synthase alpha chain